MQKLVDLDYDAAMALVVGLPDTDELIAMARYDVDPATRLADIAFVVRDDWQRRGVGTLLLRRMTEIARARGLAGFTAQVLATNKPMLMLLYQSGLKLRTTTDAGIHQVIAHF